MKTTGIASSLRTKRWPLPIAILVSLGITWLINPWASRMFHRFVVVGTAQLWEPFLLYGIWEAVFLLVILLAAESPSRRLLGGILIGVGLCAVFLQLVTPPGSMVWFGEWFKFRVVLGYSRIMFRYPYSLALARAALGMGILLMLPTGLKYRFTDPCSTRVQAWIEAFLIPVAVLGLNMLIARILPENCFSEWNRMHIQDARNLLRSVGLAVIWLRVVAAFSRTRWAALPWFLASSAVISFGVVLGVPSTPEEALTLRSILAESPALLTMVPRFLAIGLVGLVVASWRRARTGTNLKTSAVVPEESV